MPLLVILYSTHIHSIIKQLNYNGHNGTMKWNPHFMNFPGHTADMANITNSTNYINLTQPTSLSLFNIPQE
jgi:hypothetical protein